MATTKSKKAPAKKSKLKKHIQHETHEPSKIRPSRAGRGKLRQVKKSI